MNTHSSRVGRQHILDVAERLFTEHGYRAASIRNIARECGVTNAAIYYHFPDKESLFAEVMQRHAARLGEKMTLAGEAAETPRGRVEAVLLAYAHTVMDQRAPFFLFRRGAAHSKHRHFHAHYHRLMHTILEPLIDALSAAQDAGVLRPQPEANEAASLLIGALHGFFQQRRALHEGKAALTDDDISMMVDIFWRGMATEKG
ncbi:MAG: TetR/AcrR family transcriptional regulator [Chloroflexi bacterium]|nr:TetR/AcrR family transcriptional regulator [Chloroflexota bacterium]